MKKLLNLFKLNLQLFAEPGEGNGEGGNNPQPTVNTPAVNIDYNKIEDMFNKRMSSQENSFLRGYLKEQGLTGDELNQAVSTYKQQKEQAALQAKQEQENMKLENARLKAEILNNQIDAKLTALASGENVSADKLPFLAKLIDRNGVVDDKGQIIEEKLKEAMNNVLKAFPDFKGTGNAASTGFQQIGGASNQSNGNSVDDQLDSIFGIKKK